MDHQGAAKTFLNKPFQDSLQSHLSYAKEKYCLWCACYLGIATGKKVEGIQLKK